MNRRGHYDLLYKSEDITDMAIESLRNLEVRLVSEPIYDSFGNIDFSRSEDFGAYLSDIPGFTLCTPATTFSSELYSNPSQSLPTQSIPSPTNTVSTKLAQITLAPAVAESRTRSSQSTSPPSSENTTETKFRGSTYQYEYQECRVWLRSQQAQAGLTG